MTGLLADGPARLALTTLCRSADVFSLVGDCSSGPGPELALVSFLRRPGAERT